MQYPANYSGYKSKRRGYCISKTLLVININNELKGIHPYYQLVTRAYHLLVTRFQGIAANEVAAL